MNMDLNELWQKALSETEVIRTHLTGLSSVAQTKLPYIFLGESAVNSGDTVVRKGEISVDKPSIILPNNMPSLDGFDFKENLEYSDDTILNFLLVRGVQFPSMKYNNQTDSVDVYEGKLSKAVKKYESLLQKSEDIKTSLLLGPEEAWQFSILILVGMQVTRSADRDIKSILDKYKRRDQSQ